MSIPWEERVPAISIHPAMASLDDIARLAVELMEARQMLHQLANEEIELVKKGERK